MATLPSIASLTGASTTNAGQKANFEAIRNFLADFLGTDSADKAAARALLGVPASAEFAASLAANGYKKSPSGDIEQWGNTGLIGVGSSQTITFPSPFDVTPYQGFVSSQTNSNAPCSANIVLLSKTQCIIYNTGANASIFSWRVVGK